LSLPDVIVNTSPLQYLHQVGQLGLLPKLFARIIVPGDVVAEIAAGRRLGISLPQPEALDWIDIRSPASPVGGLLAWDLGTGESAVLSLALEHRGSWVVLDDKLARQAAVHLNLPLLGTAGILLRAKHAGHLRAVKPVLDHLAALGFRLTQETARNILDLANEG
jgi:predicted nucleic acid-binding protein